MKFHYPTWIPYPSSWLNALLLLLLVTATTYLMRITILTGMDLSKFYLTPEPFVLLTILAWLSPIASIAYIHHLLHLLISAYFPKIQAPEVGNVKGLFPGLVSCWEGLYGWSVMTLSFLLCIIVATLTYRLFEVENSPTYFRNHNLDQRLTTLLSITWIVTAAYLYQLSHLIEQRLILVGKTLRKNEKSTKLT